MEGTKEADYEKCLSGILRGIFQWRWAESNRRPNNVPSSFLHVYSSFGFRQRPAERRANRSLSFKS